MPANTPFTSDLDAAQFNEAFSIIKNFNDEGGLDFIRSLMDSPNGFPVNLQMADATGDVLPDGVLARKDGQLAMHDNVTPGGNVVGLGLNHYGVAVRVTNNPETNGSRLKSAYTKAKALTPGGNALSATNRVMVLAPPGHYDFGGTPFTLDAEFVDVIGLSAERGHVLLTADLGAGSHGTIVQTANDVRLMNFVADGGSAAEHHAYWPSTNLPKTICKNVEFKVVSERMSMRQGIEYSGTYIDVVADNFSFGAGADGIASGLFIRCEANGDDSYTEEQNPFGGDTASGTFIECEVENEGFATGGTASGTFIRCKGGSGAFAGERLIHPAINPQPDGGTASGTFEDCEGGAQSFGGGNNGIASGTFDYCRGGGESFGGGDNGIASGTFDYCRGGGSSFGGGDGGTLTGKLSFCRLTFGTFQAPSGAGEIALCIDGNGDVVGGGSGGGGGSVTGLTTLADASEWASFDASSVDAGTAIDTLGYASAGDNGAGRYEIRATSVTADNFLVFDTATAGKQAHLLPNAGGFYNAKQGGVVDNDDTAAAWNRVIAVLDAAQSEDVPVYFPGGMEISVLGSSSNYTFTSHCVLFSDIGNPAKFYGDAEEEASPHEFRFNYHATLELYDIWLDNWWNSASSRWAFAGGGGVGSTEKRIVAHRCKFTRILRGGAIGAREDENGIVNPDIQDCEVDDIAFGVFNFTCENHSAKIKYNHIKDVITFRTKGTISESAIGINLGTSSGPFSLKPEVEYNFIENLKGPSGDRIAIMIDGSDSVTANNIIDGVWGTTDGTDKQTGADMEGIYNKVQRGRIESNWVFNASHPGSNDGGITIKGTEPDSHFTVITNNIVWNYDSSVYDVNSLSSAGRSIGAVTIVGNVFLGRWVFTDVVPESGGVAYQNIASTWSGNLMYKGYLQVGASAGPPGWDTVTIADSIFVSRKSATEACISGSGDMPKNVNISNVICFADGFVFNDFGAADTLNVSSSVFYSSGNNAPFVFDRGVGGIILFKNNVLFQENIYQSITTPNFTRTEDRFRATDRVIIEGNYLEIPKLAEWELTYIGRHFYFRNNIVWSPRDVPTDFAFSLDSQGSGGRPAVTFSVTDNDFARIWSLNDYGLMELIGSNWPRLHRFEWLRNRINRTEILFRSGTIRMGVIQIEDNDFTEDLDQLDDLSGSGPLSQSNVGGFARIEVNRNHGWKTEDWVNGSVEPGQTIAHSMRHAPNFVQLTPQGADDVDRFRVSAKGGSDITIQHSEVGASREFDAYVAYKYAFPSQLAAPSLVSPTDSETDVAVDTSFKWENLDGSTIHHLQISTTNAESGLIYDNNEVWGLWVDTDDANVETDGSSSFRDNLPIPDLDNGTTYWYRVRSAAGRWGTWSAWRSFTTIA